MQVKLWQKSVVNCRFIGNFDKGDMLGQGTYGIVFFAKDKQTGQTAAIKKMKILDNQEGFPVTSLREVKILNMLKSHPNIVSLKQVVVGAKKDSIFLVFEFCQIDLSKLIDQMSIDKSYFTESQIKCLFLQFAKGISYAHNKYIIHRDLKLTNVLLNKQGILKIADFGLARQFCKNIDKQKNHQNQLLVKSQHFGIEPHNFFLKIKFTELQLMYGLLDAYLASYFKMETHFLKVQLKQINFKQFVNQLVTQQSNNGHNSSHKQKNNF